MKVDGEYVNGYAYNDGPPLENVLVSYAGVESITMRVGQLESICRQNPAIKRVTMLFNTENIILYDINDTNHGYNPDEITEIFIGSGTTTIRFTVTA